MAKYSKQGMWNIILFEMIKNVGQIKRNILDFIAQWNSWFIPNLFFAENNIFKPQN